MYGSGRNGRINGMNRRTAKSILAKNKPRPSANRKLPMNVPRSGGPRITMALDRGLRVGFFTCPDPGDGGTIVAEYKGKAFCELTVGASNETRQLPPAAQHAVGTELTVILRNSDGGTATLSGMSETALELGGVGDLGIFVLSAVGPAKIWRTVYPSATDLDHWAITGIAAEPLSFGDVVLYTEDGYILSTPLDGLASGVCITDTVEIGEPLSLIAHGNVQHSDWTSATGEASLEIGKPYYLQLDGKIGTIPYSEGVILRVGRAATDTIFCVTFELKVA